MSDNKKNLRLVDNLEKDVNFKNWIIQHNPELNWNFDDPIELISQLAGVIKSKNDLDLRTVFELFFANDETGLEERQDTLFLKSNY